MRFEHRISVILAIALVAAACSSAVPTRGQEVSAPVPTKVPTHTTAESTVDSLDLADAATSNLAVIPEGRFIYVSNQDGGRNLYTIKTDGTDLIRVTEKPLGDAVTGFVLAPDGERLAAVREIDNIHDNVIVLGVDGRDETKVSTGDYTNYWPRWSPDGRSITYENLAEGLLVVQADGTGERVIANFGSYENYSEAPWLHDGSAVAYQRVSHLGYQIILLSTIGRPERVVLESSRITTFALSPIEPTMVFTELVERYGDEGSTFMLDLESGDRIQLTDLPGKDRLVTWSPDGKKIAFFHVPLEGPLSLRVMNADGSDMSVLLEGDILTNHPIWAPNSDALTVVYQEPDTFGLTRAIVDLDGNVFDVGEARRVVGWIGP